MFHNYFLLLSEKLKKFLTFRKSCSRIFHRHGISSLIEYTAFLSSRKIRYFQGENFATSLKLRKVLCTSSLERVMAQNLPPHIKLNLRKLKVDNISLKVVNFLTAYVLGNFSLNSLVISSIPSNQLIAEKKMMRMGMVRQVWSKNTFFTITLNYCSFHDHSNWQIAD